MGHAAGTLRLDAFPRAAERPLLVGRGEFVARLLGWGSCKDWPEKGCWEASITCPRFRAEAILEAGSARGSSGRVSKRCPHLLGKFRSQRRSQKNREGTRNQIRRIKGKIL